MSELVLLHHNEPMTTSLAIAEGTENSHQAVLKMVRTYIAELQNFGEVGFQIRLNQQGSPTEFAFLNEPQATLLITFLRNSETVVKFKVALVKAFYELRDRLAVPPAPTFGRVSDPGMLYPFHEADKIVTSDRIFRAVQRIARSSGMTTDAAYEVARKVAHGVSGVDLAGLVKAIDKEMHPPLKDAAEGARIFFAAAEAGEIEHVSLGDTDYDLLMDRYRFWCKEKHYRVGSLDWHLKNYRYRLWKAEKESV